MAGKTLPKYEKDYIIKRLTAYANSKQHFSHLKQACLLNNWNYKHMKDYVIPKHIEEEKNQTEKPITDLIQKIKDKHEIFLLTICSTSVHGAIFQLKSNYGYKNTEEKTDVDSNTINLVTETHKKIMEEINKKDI